MQSLSLSSLLLPPRPFSDTNSRHHKIRFRQKSRPTESRREAYNDHFGGGGGSVDEDMIVLRMRIHEIKMAEMDSDLPPADWMDWEKHYSFRYYSDVCELVGLLQSFLMNTRPSLALGLVALVMLSVPTTMAVVLFKLMEMAKAVMMTGGFHLS